MLDSQKYFWGSEYQEETIIVFRCLSLEEIIHCVEWVGVFGCLFVFVFVFLTIYEWNLFFFFPSNTWRVIGNVIMENRLYQHIEFLKILVTNVQYG